MKKVVFTLVVLCLSLMTQSACSGKSAKAEQATEQSGEQAAGESVASQNELSDKILGLIEDATDKVKDCTDLKRHSPLWPRPVRLSIKLVKMPVRLCRVGYSRLAIVS